MKKIIFLMITLLSMAPWSLRRKHASSHLRGSCAYQGSLIHTNNNHWARTDYRGYWNMRYQFDSATVSKPGYIKATIRYQELPDTVFLLPEAKQIGEVTVWGKNQEHIDNMEEQIQEKVNSVPTSPGGIGFDASAGWTSRAAATGSTRSRLRKSSRRWTERIYRLCLRKGYGKEV